VGSPLTSVVVRIGHADPSAPAMVWKASDVSDVSRAARDPVDRLLVPG
jgi:hypothetical protein